MKACLRQAVWSGLGLAVLWVATSVGLMHMYPRVWKSFALTTGSVSVDTVILSPVCCGVGVAYGARLRRAGVTRTSRAWPRSATAAIVTTWLMGVGAVLLLAVGVTTAILALVASGDADPRLVMGSVLTAMAATAFLALGPSLEWRLVPICSPLSLPSRSTWWRGPFLRPMTCSSDGLVLRPSTAPLRISPGTPSRCGLDSIVPPSSSPWCSWP